MNYSIWLTTNEDARQSSAFFFGINGGKHLLETWEKSKDV